MEHTSGKWKAKETHTMSSSAWYVLIDENGRGPIFEVGGNTNVGQIAEAKYLITDPEVIRANAIRIATVVSAADGMSNEQAVRYLEHGKRMEALINDVLTGDYTHDQVCDLIIKMEGK